MSVRLVTPKTPAEIVAETNRKNHYGKPGKDTKAGRELRNATNSNSGFYDPEFTRELHRIIPQWFPNENVESIVNHRPA